MLGTVALSKGNRAAALLLLQFTADELEELIALYREG